MKIREGFVSNSSSMSFIVSHEDYPSIFELAKEMIKIRDQLWYEIFNDVQRMTLKPEDDLIKQLEEAEKRGMHPNTPVFFDTTNYSTYIVEYKGDFYVETCNNHNFWDEIIIDHLIEDGFEDKNTDLQKFFYICTGKMKRIKKWF